MANYYYFWYYVVFTLVLMSLLMQEISAGKKPKPKPTAVPCFFIFGDSYVDSGNNNNLPTKTKADYYPYGVDLHNRSTGRFTNGKTITDFIGKHLGFQELIPPHAAHSKNIKLGVNYGSGFAGIREITGKTEGKQVYMKKQLSNHNETRMNLRKLMGNDQAKADKYLKKCLYAVNIGSNDYVNNYFVPKYYKTSKKYKLDQYTNILIQQYYEQMKALYDINARKVALFGLIPLGCVPGELMYNGKTMECKEKINDGVRMFNQKLKALVIELNQELRGANFIFINTSSIFTAAAIAKAPSPDGYYSKKPCCKVMKVSSDEPPLSLCMRNNDPCKKRNQYVYWDNFHLTEIINKDISWRSYKRQQPSDAYPKDIHQLVHN